MDTDYDDDDNIPNDNYDIEGEKTVISGGEFDYYGHNINVAERVDDLIKSNRFGKNLNEQEREALVKNVTSQCIPTVREKMIDAYHLEITYDDGETLTSFPDEDHRAEMHTAAYNAGAGEAGQKCLEDDYKARHEELVKIIEEATLTELKKAGKK